ncbi:Myc-type, basic helix-loop-helix [Sesbania bispinosa]|nr:Myc-type, basic helix-loop-helix [Sesbania bispinosa]
MESFEPNIGSSNSDTLQESNHNKRRKIGDHDAGDQNSLNLMPWRSDTEQQIYSRKLVEALRRIPSPAATKPRVAGQVRETADRVLAATAKGRTRWSRAILGRWKKLQRQQHKKVKKAGTAAGLKRRPGISGERRRRLPAVQKKARVLSRLVPGCRKLSFPNLLEEATDYISALEMQVRAMTTLAELLAGGAPAGLAGHVLS